MRTLITMIFFTSILLHHDHQPTSNPPSAAMQLWMLPTRLEIPEIKVKAGVDKVGLLPNRAMDVPKTFDRVGLLFPGTLPGQIGNAVIDGHVDHYTGPAIFFNLKKLKAGDKIIVSNDSETLTFIITSVEAFKTKEAPLNRIFGPAETANLNLITCTGHFNRKRKEHEMRLVVFSRLADVMQNGPTPVKGAAYVRSLRV